MPDRPITLIVETAAGVLIREIPSASPLPEDRERGTAAEEATHDAASVWGLPDFLFNAQVLGVGSGSREIGDRLLLVGDLGVVIQVKSRVADAGDEEKERRWIEKHVAKGLRQAHGTIRRLKSGPARLTNARGRSIEVDGSEFRWLAVVVIDHPGVPEEVSPPVEGQPNPSVVILRRDWEFLFDQLTSTHAVTRYLERVAGEPLELGDEPARYYERAQADANTPPDPMDPRLLVPRGRRISSPLLPLRPVGSEDETAHLLVRALLEDIAAVGPGNMGEADRLRVLAELDRLPVTTRAEIGRFLIEAMESTSRAPEGGTEWRVRWVRGRLGGERIVQLGYGTCSVEHSTMIQDLFASLVRLRHHDVREVVGNSLVTVGIVLTPRTDGVRPWDTTMLAITGDPELDDEQLALLRELWPAEAPPQSAGRGRRPP